VVIDCRADLVSDKLNLADLSAHLSLVSSPVIESCRSAANANDQTADLPRDCPIISDAIDRSSPGEPFFFRSLSEPIIPPILRRGVLIVPNQRRAQLTRRRLN